ncbi:hypothetical protein PBAL39_20234 [Pedobacter sp. BAL39]|uniref:DUF6266 family protein n=1 Tax=Pedobacter sp. BAL39 TaxID=391596 RepID=UPI0001559A1A|nr:DUF6266 family protein [Pedobacter sp. BAL39]EDM36248.1 hypothetical protein PBAL39_20234 [Pedobacter sp. BAL39]
MAIHKKTGYGSEASTGRIGNVVFYILNGKLVSRTIGKTNSVSDKQRTVRQKMSTVIKVLSSVYPYINIGFEVTAKKQKKNPHNIAVSLNFDAASGTYPNVQFDYTKMILSKGTLQAPAEPRVELQGNELQFTWDDPAGPGASYASDQVMLLAYYPEIHHAVFVIAGGKRSSLRAVLALPKLKGVTIVETYMSFRSGNQKMISNSVYTGQIIISKSLNT